MRPRDWHAASVFQPENLLREARRQKRLAALRVPPVVVLDPDGDLARHVATARDAVPDPGWACYHTRMLSWGAGRLGVVAHAVGAPFAVLVAEQLFASGCELVINLTSAGQLADLGPPPYFVVIDRARRDEGTSYHYAPPAEYADADPALIALLWPALAATGRLLRGASWTTDAPYRETAASVADAQARGLLLVEMEAAGLYAFAAAQRRAVLCIAHVTNRMAQDEGDFDKGEGEGAPEALRLVEAAAGAWAQHGALPQIPREDGRPLDT